MDIVRLRARQLLLILCFMLLHLPVVQAQDERPQELSDDTAYHTISVDAGVSGGYRYISDKIEEPVSADSTWVSHTRSGSMLGAVSLAPAIEIPRGRTWSLRSGLEADAAFYRSQAVEWSLIARLFARAAVGQLTMTPSLDGGIVVDPSVYEYGDAKRYLYVTTGLSCATVWPHQLTVWGETTLSRVMGEARHNLLQRVQARIRLRPCDWLRPTVRIGAAYNRQRANDESDSYLEIRLNPGLTWLIGENTMVTLGALYARRFHRERVVEMFIAKKPGKKPSDVFTAVGHPQGRVLLASVGLLHGLGPAVDLALHYHVFTYRLHAPDAPLSGTGTYFAHRVTAGVEWQWQSHADD